MVKNIIIAVLVIISLSTMIFAMYQRAEASRQEALAMANVSKVEEVIRVAESARKEAENHSAAAATAVAELENQLKLALEKCK